MLRAVMLAGVVVCAGVSTTQPGMKPNAKRPPICSRHAVSGPALPAPARRWRHWRRPGAMRTVAGMRAPKKPTAEKLRSWRVPLMRSRTHYLGVVYAPDEKSAEAAAIAEFKIGAGMRRRLIVRPDDD